MAKKALLDVLEQTIGKYVKDLDAGQVNLAVWTGRIELNSLELDVEAVNNELDRQAAEAPNLSIPLRAVRGCFGSLCIEVPWSRLMSQPVVLTAHGLNISVEVHDRHATADFLNHAVESEFKRAKAIMEARVKAIISANEHRLRKKAMAELANLDMEASKSTSGNSSFSSRLVRRIIENIQLEVHDVHISLESGDSSAGIKLEALTLFTTDAKGKRSFVDRTSGDKDLANSFLFKALQIRGLGIYLDENDSIYHSMQSISEAYISDSNRNKEQQQQDHSYILSPLSFEATLRQADSNICIDYPKYLLSSKLPALSVILSKSQLEFAAKIVDQVRPSDDVAKPLFPEYRPLCRVSKDTAAEWWRYAYRCVGRLSGRRAWSEFYYAFKKRKAYIPLYKRDTHHATCRWLSPLNAEEWSELQAIERDRAISVEGIMTWRSIADAQVEKEQQKYVKTQAKKAPKKSSFFFGTYGSSAIEDSSEADEEPPITLTVEEMKELETISMTQMAQEELSNDSKLCNIHFVLGSLKLNLNSYDLRPVVALSMGRVTSAFKANADGSFTFGFKLTSLDLTDMVTPKSFFPNVLSSLDNTAASTITSTNESAEESIFMFNLSKTKEGDQKLTAKLVSFQAVSSPLLLTELKRFFTISSGTRHYRRATAKQNPLLAQSLSGSVDLFYDADEGGESMMAPLALPVNGDDAAKPSKAATTTFSNALIDAWKEKTKTKASWVVDLDIRAPILVLPENCVDGKANVLVLDLGHLRLQYGKIQESTDIQTWFKQHPKCDGTEAVVDNGKLAVTHLTFMVTEAETWHSNMNTLESGDAQQIEKEAVVEPISISFDFSLESVSTSDLPRCCVLGVVPSIALRISPTQLSKALNVYSAWKRLLEDIKPSSTGEPLSDLKDIGYASKGRSKSVDFQALAWHGRSGQADTEAAFPIFHFSVWLQRLSLMIAFDVEGELDAHLVSVNTSLSSMSDGSSVANLSMGWFWILDRFQGAYARRQRLLAHSSLPLSPESFAASDHYDILKELESQGVFKAGHSGSSELANITYKNFGSSRDLEGPIINQFTSDKPFEGKAESGRIDAKFSSLYIHWNPQAIKTLTRMLGKFWDFLDSSRGQVDDPLLIVSAAGNAGKSRKETSLIQNEAAKGAGHFIVNAEMQSFEICLNSARDDLPLYILTMSRAKVSTLSSGDDGLLVSLALGDFRLSTPELGETLSDYRTLLGLAPGRTDSLLSVNYFRGPKAMEGVEVEDAKKLNQCEAFADVELSPMRMVYIHAQVMALVEYISEGILGALAAQAASSAVAAAADMATASDASRLYHVKATAFDFVLPQSARHVNHIAFHAGDLKIVYKSFVDPGGSEASIILSDVSLNDSSGAQMQKEPIRMNVEVTLPPLDIGTIEEQTMRVDIDISSAAFMVSKSQYAQIMHTMDRNISEVDLFLRGETKESFHGGDAAMDESAHDEIPFNLTHAGVAAVVVPRRMYVYVKISVLSLELLFAPEQPLVRLAAVDAKIDFRSFPDEARKHTRVTLGNLEANDQRPKAIKRQYQSLIYQIQRESSIGKGKEAVQDVFFVSYESFESGDTKYDIKIGCPRIVCVPDVVSVLHDFISVEGRVTQVPPEVLPAASSSADYPIDSQDVTVGDDDGGGDGFEVSLQPRTRGDKSVTKMSLSVITSRCSIVLVDLGGDMPSTGSPSDASSEATLGGQVVENLVLEGKCNTKLLLASSRQTGETTSLDLQVQGDAVE